MRRTEPAPRPRDEWSAAEIEINGDDPPPPPEILSFELASAEAELVRSSPVPQSVTEPDDFTIVEAPEVPERVLVFDDYDVGELHSDAMDEAEPASEATSRVREWPQAVPRLAARSPGVWIVAFVIGCTAYFGIGHGLHPLAAAAGLKSPVVLADKARTVFEALPGLRPASDSASGFAAVDSEIGYWMRRSPGVLAGGGTVTLATPVAAPGESRLTLTSSGALRTLSILPGALAAEGTDEPLDSRETERCWELLFRAADLQVDHFAPAVPKRTPAVYADSRHAWTGYVATGDALRPERRMRIEAAALRGHPVAFAVAPADRATATPAPRRSDLRSLLWLGAWLIAVGAAWRALARDRADGEGAFKVLAIGFVVALPGSLLGSHLSFDPAALVTVLLGAAGDALLAALLPAVLWFGLAETLRRSWPRVAKSWDDALSGDRDDARVGLDLVVGAAAGGLVAATLAIVWRVEPALVHGVLATDETRLGLSARQAAAGVFGVAATGVFVALGSAAFLGLLSGLVGRWVGAATLPAVAAGAWFLWGNGATPAPTVDTWLARLAIAALVVFVLCRRGVVATIAALFTGGVLLLLPMSLDPSHWLWSHSLLALAAICGIVVTGATLSRRSSAPRHA